MLPGRNTKKQNRGDNGMPHANGFGAVSAVKLPKKRTIASSDLSLVHSVNGASWGNCSRGVFWNVIFSVLYPDVDRCTPNCNLASKTLLSKETTK